MFLSVAATDPGSGYAMHRFIDVCVIDEVEIFASHERYVVGDIGNLLVRTRGGDDDFFKPRRGGCECMEQNDGRHGQRAQIHGNSSVAHRRDGDFIQNAAASQIDADGVGSWMLKSALDRSFSFWVRRSADIDKSSVIK